MDLPIEFAEAFLNKEHTILGKRLQPYCLYHLLALQVIESPVIFGERMSLEELEQAVLICAIPLPTTQKEAARYSAKVTSLFDKRKKSKWEKLCLWLWHKRNKKHYLRELIKFQYYIKDFSTYPKISSDIKGSGNGANHILSRAGFYIQETGNSVEYVFSLPLGVLNHLTVYFSALNSGKINFVEEMQDKIALYRALTEEVKKREREGTL